MVLLLFLHFSDFMSQIVILLSQCLDFNVVLEYLLLVSPYFIFQIHNVELVVLVFVFECLYICWLLRPLHLPQVVPFFLVMLVFLLQFLVALLQLLNVFLELVLHFLDACFVVL